MEASAIVTRKRELRLYRLGMAARAFLSVEGAALILNDSAAL